MTQLVTRRLQVYGKVQGVFFRASTKKKAHELGIEGWVKNEPDSSVLIVATGIVNAMDAFESWCREGPIMASVTHLDSSREDLKRFEGFSIRAT